ncbi:MAG: hypothetical protein B6I25_01235 [Planctomycetales bacterium 4572_13]|nr:MAG: hypothetical protein B6I25_01235 [Planctomycetales bacterium 4572_13]
MTWWETEEMAVYVSGVEAALDEWTMSNSQMRHEQDAINRMVKKISEISSQTTESEKKAFLVHLASRVEGLRRHLTERLKRDIPRQGSTPE